MAERTCAVCGQGCNADMRVVHGCGVPGQQWCKHLGKHLRIALGREAARD